MPYRILSRRSSAYQLQPEDVGGQVFGHFAGDAQRLPGQSVKLRSKLLHQRKDLRTRA